MEERDGSIWLVLLVGIFLVVAFSPLFMIGIMGHRYGMGLRMLGFGFMGPFMFLVQLGFVAIIVIGLYYLLSGRERESHALRVLKVRYARGEITSEQYEKMKRDLES